MSCSWIPPQLSLFTTMCSYYSEPSIKVMGHHERVWFKNNFAKVFSACNYYAGVATTSNVVSSGVHEKVSARRIGTVIPYAGAEI